MFSLYHLIQHTIICVPDNGGTPVRAYCMIGSALQLGSDFQSAPFCLGLSPSPIRFAFQCAYSLRHSLCIFVYIYTFYSIMLYLSTFCLCFSHKTSHFFLCICTQKDPPQKRVLCLNLGMPNRLVFTIQLSCYRSNPGCIRMEYLCLRIRMSGRTGNRSGQSAVLELYPV